MGEGVGRAMGVGTKWELRMDRKPTQQDVANFEPKLCLLCSFFLTAHGLVFPVLSQPKLCLQFLPYGTRWCHLSLASRRCACSAV